MLRILGLQAVVVALVSLAALWVGGTAAAASTALGGGACWLPNALFALRLVLAARRPQGTSADVFFVGEFVKLGSTVALLALIAWAYENVVWPAVIVGVVAALKSYLIDLLLPSGLWHGRFWNDENGNR